MEENTELSEEELERLQELQEELEEFDDLPEEWMELMKNMPDFIDDFVDDKKLHEDEVLPLYFFSYFMGEYEECKPFFTCFEGGEEMFANFMSVYGDSDSEEEEKELSDDDIRELMRRHINGMNALLNLYNEGMDSEEDYEPLYGQDPMEIAIVSSSKEIPDREEWELVECADISDIIVAFMLDELLPEEEENPLAAFWEPLYEQTQNYHVMLYIIWAIAKDTDMENPFEAYKILWENDIDIYCRGQELIVVK